MIRDNIIRTVFATTVLTLLAIGTAFGQSNSFKSFYEKYTGYSGITTMQMSGSMMGSVLGNNSSEYDAIDNFWMITVDKKTAAFKSDLENLIRDDYKCPLMSINESDTKVEFYSKSVNSKVVEIMMIVDTGNNMVVMLITGNDLDINQITNISIN